MNQRDTLAVVVVTAWRTCFHRPMPRDLRGIVSALSEAQLKDLLPEIICTMVRCGGVDEARAAYEVVLRKAAPAGVGSLVGATLGRELEKGL